ncbi:MAG: YvcK family protein [Firmicutes bacterium]|nr:YvcK family protein [Bacillota bacterium]
MAMVFTVPGLFMAIAEILLSLVSITGNASVYAVLFLGMGLGLMGYAVIKLIRTLVVGLAPRNDKVVDTLYQARYLRRGPRVVVVGGGTGLSTLLRGLKYYTSNITAVVTVADDGGSSGILRGEFDMPPPGDIRNCLVALADTEPLLERLFQYRFENGSGFAGHNFGNLFLAAMTKIMGFKGAIREIGKVLAVRGTVLPVTTDNVRLQAITESGEVIWGESKIGASSTRIKELRLVPADCRVLPDVIEALANADAVIVGPGSLYTSILPNLLVPGVSEAIRKSKALKFYVCNIMTQLGETRDYTAADHLQAVQEHVGGGLFGYVVVNNKPLPADVLARYAQEGAAPVKIDRERLRSQRVRIIEDNLVHIDHVAWHNPEKLARAIVSRLAADLERPKRLLDLLLWESRVQKMQAWEERQNG